MLRTLILTIVALVTLSTLPAQAQTSHVQAQLIANVSAITPGQPFLLGMLLTVDPGWHVYWQNPGDAGLPTKVSFTVPKGFSVGPLQYPTPHRFDLPGDIVCFGYENSVLLFATVTPPPNLSADFSSSFGATSSWLVCSEQCIPGKGAAELKLGVSPSPAPSNTPLFESWQNQLPLEGAAANAIAEVTTSGQVKDAGQQISGDFTVQISWENQTPIPSSVEFIPGQLDSYNIQDTRVQTDGHQSRITFRADALAGTKPAPATLQAVIGFQTPAGQHRGIIVKMPIPGVASQGH